MSAYREGYNAYYDGVGYEFNPYYEASVEDRHEWFAGWHDAEFDDVYSCDCEECRPDLYASYGGTSDD